MRLNDRDEFERCWPWLDASLASFGRTHGKQHVWERIAAGRAKLWPNEHGVILTEIIHHPNGEGDGAALLKPPHSVSSSFAHAFHASQLF